jgi:hypothetical protein
MIALAVFDAIDAHPWVGAQLANPRQPAMLRIFESIGRAVHALGVPDAAGFTSASALTNYIVGTAGSSGRTSIATSFRSPATSPNRCVTTTIARSSSTAST